MERMPSPEEKSESLKEKPKTIEELALKSFKSFRDRPDKPLSSYEEQNRLQGESGLGNKEATQKFIESKKDKYHISAINPPLATAQLFLESEAAKRIPESERQKLEERVEKAFLALKESREKKQITEEQVKEILNILDVIQPYLE